MDRVDSAAAPSAQPEPVPAAYPSNMAIVNPQNPPQQNRLVHYIRSMPLVSLLFGRNVTPGNFTSEANNSFIFKCLMAFHLLILVTLVGLTTFAIYYYNIRLYKSQTRPSETLIVCWLVRAIWHTINSAWSLKYYCSGQVTRSNLKLSQTFYNIASILWISLAVVFLGVAPREDLKSPSSRICYFLLWITIASYVVPMLAYTVICLLLYLTVFAVIYFRHGTIPFSSTAMPILLLKKLKVLRYRDVLNMCSNLGGASADGLADCANTNELMNDRVCSICMLAIGDDDKVYLLPCDIRHIFHMNCLKKWFKRSSECPICRCNIAKLLSGDYGRKVDEEAPADQNSEQVHSLLPLPAQVDGSVNSLSKSASSDFLCPPDDPEDPTMRSELAVSSLNALPLELGPSDPELCTSHNVSENV